MKTKVIDKFFEKLRGKTVSYGSAKFSISAKGDIRVPQQGLIDRLKHRAKVVMTSEFWTTKKCSKCGEDTKSVKLEEETNNVPPPPELIKRLEKENDLERGLRLCSNRVCARFMHRDENAAENIAKVLRSRIIEGVRPEYLTRKSGGVELQSMLSFQQRKRPQKPTIGVK
jgi:hypothetical protein